MRPVYSSPLMPRDRGPGMRRALPPGNSIGLPSGVAVAAFAIALLIPMGASASGAELWRSRAGDDPRWSSPGFDDSGWRAVSLLDTWQQQGYRGVDGKVWFRRTVSLDPEARLAAGRGRLGLLLGPSTYGGYQVYAAGRLL